MKAKNFNVDFGNIFDIFGSSTNYEEFVENLNKIKEEEPMFYKVENIITHEQEKSDRDKAIDMLIEGKKIVFDNMKDIFYETQNDDTIVHAKYLKADGNESFGASLQVTYENIKQYTYANLLTLCMKTDFKGIAEYQEPIKISYTTTTFSHIMRLLEDKKFDLQDKIITYQGMFLAKKYNTWSLRSFDLTDYTIPNTAYYDKAWKIWDCSFKSSKEEIEHVKEYSK